MKKLGSIICVVLVVIGAIFAISYANYEEPNPVKDKYQNGVYTVGENGEGIYTQYFDVGVTTASRQRQRKLNAFVYYILYVVAIYATKYFIVLKIKTKAEIKKMENYSEGSI